MAILEIMSCEPFMSIGRKYFPLEEDFILIAKDIL